MVDRGSCHSDFLVQSCEWLLGYLRAIDMRGHSTILYRRRGSQHSYGYRHALLTPANGVASSDESDPKNSFVLDFYDWRFVC